MERVWHLGTRETMAQRLKTLVLAENLGSASSIYTVAHNCLLLHFQVFNSSFDLHKHEAYTWYAYMQAHIDKNK